MEPPMTAEVTNIRNRRGACYNFSMDKVGSIDSS